MSIEEMSAALGGSTYRGAVDGWRYAMAPWAILMERTDDADAGEEKSAAVARMAAGMACGLEAGVGALISFATKHGGVLVECPKCEGEGSKPCACSTCDNSHRATCAACRGSGEAYADLHSFVVLHGVSVPAWKLSAVLRWFMRCEVATVRLGADGLDSTSPRLAIEAGDARAVLAGRRSTSDEPTWPEAAPASAEEVPRGA